MVYFGDNVEHSYQLRGIDPGGKAAIAHPIINSMGEYILAPPSCKQYFCYNMLDFSKYIYKHTKFSPRGHFPPPNHNCVHRWIVVRS